MLSRLSWSIVPVWAAAQTQEMCLPIQSCRYAGYGQDPDQDQIYAQGDAYLRATYPKLSYITDTLILQEEWEGQGSDEGASGEGAR